MSIYLHNQLEFDSDTSTVIYHVWTMFCYFFPVFGAIIADSWLGKFKTIFYLSVVYAIGSVVISIAAVPDLMPARWVYCFKRGTLEKSGLARGSGVKVKFHDEHVYEQVANIFPKIIFCHYKNSDVWTGCQPWQWR